MGYVPGKYIVLFEEKGVVQCQLKPDSQPPLALKVDLKLIVYF